MSQCFSFVFLLVSFFIFSGVRAADLEESFDRFSHNNQQRYTSFSFLPKIFLMTSLFTAKGAWGLNWGGKSPLEFPHRLVVPLNDQYFSLLTPKRNFHAPEKDLFLEGGAPLLEYIHTDCSFDNFSDILTFQVLPPLNSEDFIECITQAMREENSAFELIAQEGATNNGICSSGFSAQCIHHMYSSPVIVSSVYHSSPLCCVGLQYTRKLKSLLQVKEIEKQNRKMEKTIQEWLSVHKKLSN